MNPKLKERIQTAIVFAIIMLAGIMISRYTVMALMVLISLGAGYEYSKITRFQSKRSFWWTWISGAIGLLLPFVCSNPDHIFMLIVLSFTFTIVGIINLYTRRRIVPHGDKSPYINFLYTGLTLGLMAKYLYDLPNYYPLFLLSIFGFIWTSDSAAYLVGSQIGKTKLFQKVSPNKTWEGSIAAGLFSILLAIALYFSVGMFDLSTWIILAIIIWVMGTYGDLVESSIKRQYDIKDSGSFMPGHGGFLDRFDSFIYVIPSVLLLLKFLK